MKALNTIWIYGWAYVFILMEQLDRLADWMADQIDHNNYLAGAIGALALMAIPYIIGVFDIVVRG